MSAKPKSRSDKPIEDVMKNLTIDPASDVNLAAAPPRVASSDATSGSVKSSDIDQEYSNYNNNNYVAAAAAAAAADQQGVYYPPNSYYGYYYPGYDASVGEVEDQGGYYFSNDGLELQYPAAAAAMQADNGSLLYYMQPNYQSGYVPYNPYSPGTAIGIDGQYLSPQSYMLSPVSPQPVSPSFYYPNPLSYGSEVMQSYVWDPSFQVADVAQGNSYGYPTVPVTKQHVPSHTIASSKSTPLSKSNSDTKPSLPALDVSATGMYNDLKQVNKAAAVLAKSYYPLSKFPYTNQGKGGLLYPTASVKVNGRGWGGPEKLKPRGKTGVGEFDLLNEQNRGPRTNSTKSTVVSGTDQAESLVAEGNDTVTVIRRDEYNIPDFNTKYEHGLFFVIKSYSEDDIHKSIKYNVWASTPNGNKRLDSAYQIAQEKMNQKGSKCPVFLFFSVNASGQFCGVAEMMGRVDFDQNMDFWQQDKWNGFFPVKWHFIKDVPNPHFRHIILENNDNKPVTNSRDTQEIRLPQGLEMLNVFKNYVSKTSILDDFAFYESRQKVMEDKRIRTPIHHYGHFQKLDELTQVAVNTQPSAEVTQIAVTTQSSEEVTQVADKTQSITLGDTNSNNEPLVGDTEKE